jgi:hypothetical protein
MHNFPNRGVDTTNLCWYNVVRLQEVQVRFQVGIKAIVVGVCALAALFAGRVKSTENYMLSLPVYKHYQCLLCHNTAAPVSADLNAFGNDFKKNGYTWNAALAMKDSDGDGFPNGDELGDANGDGIADVSIERSNPGDRLNTPNSVNRSTWGILKSLFED